MLSHIGECWMSEADLVCESVEWVRRELRDLMGKQKKERPWLNCPTEREWALPSFGIRKCLRRSGPTF